MEASQAHDAASPKKIIALELETFLRKVRLRRLYFADSSVAPPPLAYITNFPRLLCRSREARDGAFR